MADAVGTVAVVEIVVGLATLESASFSSAKM